MKKLIYLLILVVTQCSPVSTSMKPNDMQELMDYTENHFKLQKTMQRIEKGEIDSYKLQIIWLILQNTPEYYIHNLNGVSGNKVFIHEDGHIEAVYDKNGKLVQDGINAGSYNYFDRRKHPLKHFSFDTHQWIMWGNSRKDTTSKQERIFGYVSDLEVGLRKALESKDNLKNIQKDNWDRNGQLQALAIFILVQERAKTNSLFSLFEKDTSFITDKDICNVLIDLELGFNNIYIYALADGLTIDGSTQSAFETSLSQMASSLGKDKSLQLMEACMKITMSIDYGELKSREEARQKSSEAMRKKLNGKSFEQIIAMAKELPDDPQLLKEMEDFKYMGTSSEYQHDADIERLKHLKYWGGIIEEFKEKNGHYPLQNNSPTQNYVYITSPRHQQYPHGEPPYEHTKTDITKFKEVLENGLGRKIDLPFDPQLVPVNKPNFYIYMIQGDRYFFNVHLHDGEGFGRKLGPYYYKAEISNVAIPQRNIFTFKELLSSEAFKIRINDSYIFRKPPKNP